MQIRSIVSIQGTTSLDFVSSLDTLHLIKVQEIRIVSRSSTELEYHSMTSTIIELLLLSYLLKDLHISIKFPLTLFYDSKLAQLLAANPYFHDQIKHFAIDFHFTRDKIQDGFLQTSYIPSSSQLPNLFTKSLPPKPHSLISSKLGLLHIEGRWCWNMQEIATKWLKKKNEKAIQLQILPTLAVMFE